MLYWGAESEMEQQLTIKLVSTRDTHTAGSVSMSYAQMLGQNQFFLYHFASYILVGCELVKESVIYLLYNSSAAGGAVLDFILGKLDSNLTLSFYPRAPTTSPNFILLLKQCLFHMIP